MAYRIVSTQTEFVTPWFELISKRVAGEAAPFYALRMADYVSVIAFTSQDELILVRQYRPAIERPTLELPSGHVENGETPVESARRELAEECGFDVPQLEPLGVLLSDTGRHENRLWCYYSPQAIPLEANRLVESGLERVLVPRSTVPQLLISGEFDQALHVAALMLAMARHGPKVLALR